MADGGLTFDQVTESLRHVDEHARDQPSVHWPGQPEQRRFVPPSDIRTPTRCGMFDLTAVLTWQRELLTCPACRDLVAADDAETDTWRTTLSINPSDLAWRKATASSLNGACVELAQLPGGGVAVRDSKDPDGPVLQFTAPEWQAFLQGVDAGEFNDLRGESADG